jgi:hypothetical protein
MQLLWTSIVARIRAMCSPRSGCPQCTARRPACDPNPDDSQRQRVLRAVASAGTGDQGGGRRTVHGSEVTHVACR